MGFCWLSRTNHTKTGTLKTIPACQLSLWRPVMTLLTYSTSISRRSSPQLHYSPPQAMRSSSAELLTVPRHNLSLGSRFFAFLLSPPGTRSNRDNFWLMGFCWLNSINHCFILLCFILFIIVSFFHFSLASWLLFSNKVQFSSVHRMSMIVHRLVVFGTTSKHYFSSDFSTVWHLIHVCLDSNMTTALYKSFTYLLSCLLGQQN